MEVLEEVREAYTNKLRNNLYALLCERERGREWEKFLDNILIELEGFDIEEKTINYLRIYHKLASCRYLSYDYFRSTIFDCMNLLGKE